VISSGVWLNNPTSFSYQWEDCDSGGANCSNNSGTASSYVVVSGDAGHTIRVVVTAHGASGDATQTSTPTGMVPGGTTDAFNDTFGGTSLATGPNQWVATDNTIGNTNTWQCDRAANTTETGGYLRDALTNGSYTCPGPSGGTGGITYVRDHLRDSS
jgi:hypothetical protein